MTGAQTPITVAYGDGIGPEIMQAALHILKEAGAALDIHKVEIGEKVYLKGHPTGIEPSTWETIRNTKAFLKAPITTPQGGGFKSLNVTIRTTLGLYANVRPCTAYAPFVQTKHPTMDLVIVRENEEDLYSGIEYRQTPDVCKSLKVISRPGSEKIVRYGFEYARHYGHKKVTCFTKDNIMKFSDGLFHKVFTEIATEYPEIENEHWIVDIGAAKLADTPEAFDLIILPNLYGDILSDVAAQISGSVGLGGSANIGDFGAMFEAIHGSAPKRAGQNNANPSGLILAAVMMLVHIGQPEVAGRIHNAWLRTIEEGFHTSDIFKQGISKVCVGTQEFSHAVVKCLGQKPQKLKAVSYNEAAKFALHAPKEQAKVKRELVGIDVYIYAREKAERFQKAVAQFQSTTSLHLNMISNRGVRIWPDGHPETFCIEQWRCRFTHKEKGQIVSQIEIAKLAEELVKAGYDIISTERLYLFDGQPGYTAAEG
jgi:isocitrate dehydrogenase